MCADWLFQLYGSCPPQWVLVAVSLGAALGVAFAVRAIVGGR